MNPNYQIENFLEYLECDMISLITPGLKTFDIDKKPWNKLGILRIGNAYAHEVNNALNKTVEGGIYNITILGADYNHLRSSIELKVYDEKKEIKNGSIYITQPTDEFLIDLVWILKSIAKIRIERNIIEKELPLLELKIETKIAELMNKSEQII